MRSAPTLKSWMTPFSSVAMLEKLALLRMAFWRAPVLRRAFLRRTSTAAVARSARLLTRLEGGPRNGAGAVIAISISAARTHHEHYGQRRGDPQYVAFPIFLVQLAYGSEAA